MYTLLFRSILAAIAAIAFAYLFRKQRIVFCFALFFYIAAVVYFVAVRGERTGLSGVNLSFPLPFYIAIRDHHYGLTTNRSVLNVILFLPFGYMVPQMFLLFRRKRIKWWHVLLLGTAFSLLIETCQTVLRFGVFDVDDLIKNTMGAVIGYCIWRLLK